MCNTCRLLSCHSSYVILSVNIGVVMRRWSYYPHSQPLFNQNLSVNMDQSACLCTRWTECGCWVRLLVTAHRGGDRWRHSEVRVIPHDWTESWIRWCQQLLVFSVMILRSNSSWKINMIKNLISNIDIEAAQISLLGGVEGEAADNNWRDCVRRHAALSLWSSSTKPTWG